MKAFRINNIVTCVALATLATLLAACAMIPKAAYRGYTGEELPETSLAIVKWRDADWAKFNDIRLDGGKYGSILLRPGTYRLEFGQTRITDVRIGSPVSETIHGTVTLKAGQTYRLKKECTHQHGHVLEYWMYDSQGNFVENFPSLIKSAGWTRYIQKVYVPQEISENISMEQRKAIAPAMWKDDFLLKITRKYPEFDPIVNSETQGVTLTRYGWVTRLCMELELRFRGQPLENAEDILSYGASIIAEELPKYY